MRGPRVFNSLIFILGLGLKAIRQQIIKIIFLMYRLGWARAWLGLGSGSARARARNLPSLN